VCVCVNVCSNLTSLQRCRTWSRVKYWNLAPSKFHALLNYLLCFFNLWLTSKSYALCCSLDLEKTFGDPCLGVRKVLKIYYCTRGFQGAIRVREKNGLLVAPVEIGFEPEVGADTAPEQKRPMMGPR
jgi:hypothetical protein